MGDEKYSYESVSASTGAGKCLVETTTGAKQDPVSAVPSQVSPIREGGYGYVVVFAAFMTQFIVDGICYSYGIISLELKDYFEATAFETSFVGSILSAAYLITGQSISAVLNRYSAATP